MSSTPEHHISEYVRNQLSLDRSSFESLFVPGRIEVLGKHTDYAGGSSIVAASSLGIMFSYRPRVDRVIEVHAIDMGEVTTIDISTDRSAPAGHWSAYVEQVARRVFTNFDSATRGATIIISSSLPIASGMSSSSAFIIGIYQCLANINEISEDPEYAAHISSNLDLADFLSTVENGGNYRGLEGFTGVGTLGGSEDHTAILASRSRELGWFSYRPTELVEYVPFPSDLSFVVLASGVTAEKSGAVMEDYNRASRQCSEIVVLWNEELGDSAPHLGNIVRQPAFSTEEMRKVLTAAGRDDLISRFTQFYFEEQEIIPEFVAALKLRDRTRISKSIQTSFDLADTYLGNQIDETRYSVQIARGLGAVGASAFGAGFGGSIYALVETQQAESFSTEWLTAYLDRFPEHIDVARVFIDRPGQGLHSDG